MNTAIWKKITVKSLADCLIISSILALGAILRLYHLDFLPLWYDEAVSYTRALMPISEIIEKTIATDTWPPLYYIFLHYLIHPGSSEFSIRISSALFSILTILFTYFIAKIISSKPVAFLSALLVAISPLHITYGQEARGYALYCLAAATAMLGLVFAVNTVQTTTQSKQRLNSLYQGLTIYSLGSVILLYTNNIGIFFVFSANIFGLYWLWTVRFNKPILIAWFGFNFLILLLWAFWIPALLEQKQNSTGGVNWFGSDLPALTDMLNDMWISYIWKYRPIFTTLILLSLIITWQALRLKIMWLVFIFCFTLLPISLAYVISQYTPLLVSRAFIWVSIPLLISIGLAIYHLKNKWLKGAAIVLLILLSAKGNATYFNDFSKERWDLVALHIASNYQKNDGILITPGFLKQALVYYVEKENPSIRIDSFPKDHSIINDNDISELEDYREHHRRIWLVKAHSSDPNNLLLQSLEMIMHKVSHDYFLRTGFSSDCKNAKCIEVYLLEPRN